jgi:hypothetical protein
MVIKLLVTERVVGTGKCRKLQNEELHDLYSSSNIIRAIKLMRIKWVAHVVKENTYTALAGKSEVTRSLG